MSSWVFQLVVDRLLAAHYGITVADTMYADARFAAQAVRQGTRPHAAVAALAMRLELARIDVTGPQGAISTQPVTSEDEARVIAAFGGFVIVSPAQRKRGRAAFWSNTEGWTHQRQATVFAVHEVGRVHLPISSANDAVWRVACNDAVTPESDV